MSGPSVCRSLSSAVNKTAFRHLFSVMPSLDQFCFAGIQRANASIMREACSCNSLFRGSLQRLAHAVSAFELIFALIDGRQLVRQREPSRPSLLNAGAAVTRYFIYKRIDVLQQFLHCARTTLVKTCQINFACRWRRAGG